MYVQIEVGGVGFIGVVVVGCFNFEYIVVNLDFFYIFVRVVEVCIVYQLVIGVFDVVIEFGLGYYNQIIFVWVLCLKCVLGKVVFIVEVIVFILYICV